MYRCGWTWRLTARLSPSSVFFCKRKKNPILMKLSKSLETNQRPIIKLPTSWLGCWWFCSRRNRLHILPKKFHFSLLVLIFWYFSLLHVARQVLLKLQNVTFIYKKIFLHIFVKIIMLWQFNMTKKFMKKNNTNKGNCLLQVLTAEIHCSVRNSRSEPGGGS